MLPATRGSSSRQVRRVPSRRPQPAPRPFPVIRRHLPHLPAGRESTGGLHGGKGDGPPRGPPTGRAWTIPTALRLSIPDPFDRCPEVAWESLEGPPGAGATTALRVSLVGVPSKVEAPRKTRPEVARGQEVGRGGGGHVAIPRAGREEEGRAGND